MAELAVFCRALPVADTAKAKKAQRHDCSKRSETAGVSSQESRGSAAAVIYDNISRKTKKFNIYICGYGGTGRRASFRC